MPYAGQHVSWEGKVNVASLVFSKVGDLRTAVAEAARTDQTNAGEVSDRFVEISVGLVSKLSAKRHHLLTGRRGAGKSTHLHYVRRQLDARGTAAPLIDMEVFKDRQYPDVLLEIMIALLDAIKPGPSSFRPADLVQRRRVSKLRKKLTIALNEPQTLTTTYRDAHASRRGGKAALAAKVKTDAAAAELGANAESGTSRELSRTAEFEALKIDRMKELAGEISKVLAGLVAHSKDQSALIFLDDFYFVRIGDQADVLDFLHRVSKGTGVWLKVGGVGSRVAPFKDGDPPVGMQLSQDIDNLAIDVTLGDFASAKKFLEDMFDGVIKPLDLTVDELFTTTARDRMVLACGGAVARDYITLTEAAVQEAIERENRRGTTGPDTVIRVRSEDVHKAIGKRISDKETESIRRDAEEVAVALNSRWHDVCEFAKERGDSAFVLVEQSRLEGDDWGKEIQQLENLRLLHRIGEAVPNTDSWRGRRAVIFMVDLGQIVVQRLTADITPFWQNQTEFEKLRRAQWVYEPNWRSRPTVTSRVSHASEAQAEHTLLDGFEDV